MGSAVARQRRTLAKFALESKHDDQVDSTAQSLEWFKTPMPGWGIFVYYRQRPEALDQRRKPPPVKTVWAIGSMEWQAEQEKADRTAASVEPLCLAGHQQQGATTELAVAGD